LQVVPQRDWVGGRFPLLPAIDVGNKLEHGEWIVVLYRNGCPKCVDELRRYEQLEVELRARAAPTHIACIEVPPHAEGDDAALPHDTHCLRGTLPDEDLWPYVTPTAFVIHDGIVKSLVLTARS